MTVKPPNVYGIATYLEMLHRKSKNDQWDFRASE